MTGRRTRFARHLAMAVVLALASTFCLTCGPGNQAPGQPAVPNGRWTGVKNWVYMFTSIAVDPDGDSVCYRFRWGDGDTSRWTNLVPSGQSGEASHCWSDSGTFAVRAQAKDDGGIVSIWSDGLLITVADTLIRAPIQPLGADSGGIGIIYEFESWSEEQDSLDMYSRFDWGDGSGSEWEPYPGIAEGFEASHAWSRAGTYEIRAQVKDHMNHLSFWSLPCTVRLYTEPGR
jgi:hypothetical protein